MTTSWLTAFVVCTAITRSAETLNTPTLSLTIQDGVITGFAVLRTGEAVSEKPFASLSGLRRLKDRHLWADTGTSLAKRDADALTVTTTWQESDGSSHVLTQAAPQPDGDVIVTQQAASNSPGLVGVQWGCMVPDSWDVLVPGWSGQRFNARTAYERCQFDYPMGWESQFVLLQGKRGGVLIHAEDDAERFKCLHLDHQKGRFLIGLETRCSAPFDSLKQATSVRWRIHAYEGDWLVGAGVYRDWAAKTFGLTSIDQRQPAWIKDVQFVVITDLNDSLLKALARAVLPARTLLYVPSWRRDEYDRNYPDYTPRDGFDGQVRQARALGFRVMLHVNYFGVTPENPHYESLRKYHCRDPFSSAPLYWDWQRATPPIKFAYINPAASAWRDLFVRLMVNLCEQLKPDALHLDQTLCIFNDANGLIDGRNMMQGNLAIHQALREALPGVALSGEGLNEITCRREAFAQRHVAGINHADGDWNDVLIARAHPVSSAIVAPYTTMYGYLGMANPQPEDHYFAWRKAYERFGVVPTLAFPSLEQMTDAPPTLRVLLAEARWFQQNRPVPDFVTTWSPETLYAWRTTDAGKAEFCADANGVALTTCGSSGQVISRRIADVASVCLPGSIPGWRVYDDRRILGLDPARSYAYLDEPRDLNAFHVSLLPETAVVRRICFRPEFATLSFDDRRTIVADLCRFIGPARSGEMLRDGTSRHAEGSAFSSDAGTDVRTESEAIFAHPPWHGERVADKGVNGLKGIGAAWIEFDVELPPDKPARFEAGIGLRSPEAVKGSDGVTFRAIIRSKDTQTQPLFFERHVNVVVPEPIFLDLAGLRGRSVIVRLETHPGSAGSPTFDWALWKGPRIILTEPYAAPIEVVCPHPILGVIGGAGPDSCRLVKPKRYALTVSTPGKTILLFQQPSQAELPQDLSKLPFSQRLVFDNGTEEPPHGFLQAKPDAGTVGGVTRQGLFAHPPSKGCMYIDFLLALPPEPARITGSAGLRDGCKNRSNGVGFRIAVNGRVLWTCDARPDGDWAAFDVSLADFAGRTVVLALITDALKDYTCDWAQWGEPRLVPLK